MEKLRAKNLLEIVSYAVVIIGFVLDQLSTRFALLFPHLFYETNELAIWLMANRLWVLFDACIISGSILIPYFLIRKKPKLFLLISYPLVVGVLKCAVGIRNYFFVFETLLGR